MTHICRADTMPRKTTKKSTRVDHPPVATSTDGLPLPAPPHRTIVLVLGALFAGVGLTHYLDGHSAAKTLVGYLRAEQTVIVSPADAKISEISQEPGTVVHPGQVVALLANGQLETRIAAQRRDVQRRQSELEQTRAQAAVELSLKTHELEAQEFQVRSLVAAHLEKQYYNEFQQAAWEDIIEQSDGVASNASTDEIFRLGTLQRLLTSDEARVRAVLRQEAARDAAEVNRTQVQLCRKRIVRLEQIQAELPTRIRQAAGVDVAQQQLDDTRAGLTDLEQVRERLTLKATAYGTVGLYLKQPGDLVSTGDPIVELYDRERQHIDLPVPSRLITRFPLGTLVKLQFAGSQKCRGRISRVPPHTDQSRETADGEDPLVRLTVEPVGRLWPSVPVGSSVEVTTE